MDPLETKMNWGTPIPLYALPRPSIPGRPYFHPRLETWEENRSSPNAFGPSPPFHNSPISDLGG